MSEQNIVELDSELKTLTLDEDEVKTSEHPQKIESIDSALTMSPNNNNNDKVTISTTDDEFGKISLSIDSDQLSSGSRSNKTRQSRRLSKNARASESPKYVAKINDRNKDRMDAKGISVDEDSISINGRALEVFDSVSYKRNNELKNLHIKDKRSAALGEDKLKQLSMTSIEKEELKEQERIMRAMGKLPVIAESDIKEEMLSQEDLSILETKTLKNDPRAAYDEEKIDFVEIPKYTQLEQIARSEPPPNKMLLSEVINEMLELLQYNVSDDDCTKLTQLQLVIMYRLMLRSKG